MSDDSDSSSVINRSGGANLNAEGDVNVGRDVVGRDKIEFTGENIVNAAPGSTVNIGGHGDNGVPNLIFGFFDGSSSIQITKENKEPPDPTEKSELASRIVRLDLCLVNNGICPATDIDGWIDFAINVEIFEDNSLKRYWKIYPLDPFEDTEEFSSRLFESETKTAAERVIAQVSDSFGFAALEGLIGPSAKIPGNALAQCIQPNIDGNRVSFKLEKIKQNLARLVAPIYLLFPSWDEVDSFNFTYCLNADELQNNVVGSLTVSIVKLV